ncbi:hypothetical protein B0H19DRAFT_1071733 [Mycena capillaripes]|nr:hypothetical protein B0H19DRAFT_1071733 [Mycena capillaripes]
MLTITIPPKADLPTSRAARKIDDLLQDETSVEGSQEAEEETADSDDDNASVGTDASSDSESDFDEDAVKPSAAVRATQNVAALGEQAVSRTVFELRDMEPRLLDLGHYLDQRVFGLSPEELKEIGQRYGNLMGFVSKLERVMNLPPLPQDQLPAPSRVPTVPLTATTQPEVATTSRATGSSQRKRKNILPPSPEKKQKRHQSFGVH